MNVHSDFRTAGKRTKRGTRTYPATAKRTEQAHLDAVMGSIKPLPITEDWTWSADGLITF